VAYLVMSHHRVEQLLRLVRTLRALSPGAAIVVHHDAARVPVSEADVLGAGADRLLLGREAVRWGDITQVNALTRCLREVATEFDPDWMVHLSGQDYPLRPLRELETRLAAGDAEAFLACQRVGTEAEVGDRRREESVRRYFMRYYTLPTPRAVPGLLPAGVVRALRARRPALRAVSAPMYLKTSPRGEGVRVGRRARRTPFRDGYACYKGSFWVCLSRDAVHTVLHELETRPDLLSYYARTMNPDESVLPTVLGNASGVRVGVEKLRYLRWDPGAAHPATLTTADLPAMSASGCYLARKFDVQVDSAVLNELDRRLGVEPPPQAHPGPAAANGQVPGATPQPAAQEQT